MRRAINPSAGVWWAIGIGAAVGLTASLAILQDARASAALRKTVDEARLPEPSFAMQLPRSAAEFATLDAVICECVSGLNLTDTGQPSGQPSGPGAVSEQELHDAIVLCAAKKLYPTFPWPPMTGDNPSTAELWSSLSVLAYRAMAMSLCAAVPQTNPARSPRRIS